MISTISKTDGKSMKQRIYDLDKYNNLCFECVAKNPEYVSINLGITLCEKCATFHTQLGYDVSYVRKIDDEWDDYLFAYMQAGGNTRFKLFYFKYLFDSLKKEQRYYTKICTYYRQTLKSEVECDVPPEEVPLESCFHLMDSSIITFPEFEKYIIYKGEIIPDANESSGKKVLASAGKEVGKILSTTEGKLAVGGAAIYIAAKTGAVKTCANYLGIVCDKPISKLIFPIFKFIGNKVFIPAVEGFFNIEIGHKFE